MHVDIPQTVIAIPIHDKVGMDAFSSLEALCVDLYEAELSITIQFSFTGYESDLVKDRLRILCSRYDFIHKAIELPSSLDIGGSVYCIWTNYPLSRRLLFIDPCSKYDSENIISLIKGAEDDESSILLSSINVAENNTASVGDKIFNFFTERILKLKLTELNLDLISISNSFFKEAKSLLSESDAFFRLDLLLAARYIGTEVKLVESLTSLANEPLGVLKGIQQVIELFGFKSRVSSRYKKLP